MAPVTQHSSRAALLLLAALACASVFCTSTAGAAVLEESQQLSQGGESNGERVQSLRVN